MPRIKYYQDADGNLYADNAVVDEELAMQRARARSAAQESAIPNHGPTSTSAADRSRDTELEPLPERWPLEAFDAQHRGIARGATAHESAHDDA